MFPNNAKCSTVPAYWAYLSFSHSAWKWSQKCVNHVISQNSTKLRKWVKMFPGFPKRFPILDRQDRNFFQLWWQDASDRCDVWGDLASWPPPAPCCTPCWTSWRPGHTAPAHSSLPGTSFMIKSEGNKKHFIRCGCISLFHPHCQSVSQSVC